MYSLKSVVFLTQGGDFKVVPCWQLQPASKRSNTGMMRKIGCPKEALSYRGFGGPEPFEVLLAGKSKCDKRDLTSVVITGHRRPGGLK